MYIYKLVNMIISELYHLTGLQSEWSLKESSAVDENSVMNTVMLTYNNNITTFMYYVAVSKCCVQLVYVNLLNFPPRP